MINSQEEEIKYLDRQIDQLMSKLEEMQDIIDIYRDNYRWIKFFTLNREDQLAKNIANYLKNVETL